MDIYNMTVPVSYAEFKEMPNDIKMEYLRTFGSKNRMSQVAFAKMFGVTQPTLSNYLRTHNIKVNWSRIARGECGVEEIAEESVNPEASVADDLALKPESIGLKTLSGSISMIGNASAVLETVYRMVGDRQIKATVSWEFV